MTQKTVLLVEDEVFVAMDIQMTLEDEGWTVAGPFPSTADALSYLDENIPTCAILDVRLTDGDVFPVADKLKETNIPFVFHSGHADGKALEEVYPDSAFCQKPCLPTSLLQQVTRLLSRDEPQRRAAAG
ncbi:MULTISPECIES: response regulator [Agrobacterium]|uniref:Response regulator n=1 Tax=Agrobacterium rosae TaxID=1972867 RepID=A0A1R3TGA4_9HYPH|nr:MULTISPECIES: response regulator [Agrobacterium]MDX8305358.1 response regulator [Agrobacterium rosae]MDX8312150.1 response regulator [Agrobacterium rosae]MDX8328480.1 response regulator [Agrobacterium rosae]SCX08795.1 response regulator [Agrobacterium sp. DSM 25558]SCX14846.1 response regulator [Agrobacterium rosae]